MAKNLEEDDGWIDITDLVDGGDGEESGSGEYVTKDELRSMLEEILGGRTGGGGDDEDDEWEVFSDLTASDVERIAEERVRAAIAELVGKKEARERTASKPASKPVAKKTEVKREPEPKPERATKPSFRSRLWGEQ